MPIIAMAFISTLILWPGQLFAQQGVPLTTLVMESRDIKPTFVDAPMISGNFGDTPNNDFIKGKKWMMVSFDFVAEDQLKGYIEELKFKISIEARQFHDLDDRVGVPVILTGETTFLDVPAKIGGVKSTGYFFVHPLVMDRFGGQERGFRFFGTSKSKNNNNIRIEALIGGQAVVVDQVNKLKFIDMLRDDEKWVTQCTPVTNQVLSKNQSPWANAWADVTLLIKPPVEATGN